MLYSCGMSQRDISEQIKNLYNFEISDSLVGKIVEKIPPEIAAWQKADGKAAVVVPDNVLFEGGAGEIIREKLLKSTELYTILRLPTGISYRPGVKTNVILFDKRPASSQTQTKEIWLYDMRTNIHFTLKKIRMTDNDIEDFIKCCNPQNRLKRKQTWSANNPNGRENFVLMR